MNSNLSLSEQPLKGNYAKKDWDRLARFSSIPWKLPTQFPIFSLSAARCFYLVKDLDEVLALSDRILVMHDGNLIPAETRDRAQIGLLMAGTAA